MRTLDQLLGELAVKGVDPDGVAEYVVGGLAAHRRHRNLAAGVAAALVLLGGGTAVALSGGGDPDEVVADRSAAESVERSSTDVTEPTAPTVAGETTASLPPSSAPTVPTTTALRPTPRAAPAVRAPVTVGPPPIGTAAPTTATTSSTTTTPTTVPDQPLQATLVVATPTVAVGDVVRVSVNWSDPDLPAEAQPVASYSFGDPNVGSAAASDAASTCNGGGARSGTLEGRARYTATGVRTVTVVVSSCGRILTLTAPVTVTEARFAGQAGRSVVVRVAAVTVDPENSSLTWDPVVGDEVPLPAREPGLVMHSGADQLASTVVVLPTDGNGVLRLTVPGRCTLEAAVNLTAVPAGQQAVVDMPGSCP